MSEPPYSREKILELLKTANLRPIDVADGQGDDLGRLLALLEAALRNEDPHPDVLAALSRTKAKRDVGYHPHATTARLRDIVWRLSPPGSSALYTLAVVWFDQATPPEKQRTLSGGLGWGSGGQTNEGQHGNLSIVNGDLQILVEPSKSKWSLLTGTRVVPGRG